MFFCRQLAVLGAGLMGAGIAQVSVQRGLPTILRDVSLDGVARGQGQIQTNLSKLVKRKKLTSVEREQVCVRVCVCNDLTPNSQITSSLDPLPTRGHHRHRKPGKS